MAVKTRFDSAREVRDREILSAAIQVGKAKLDDATPARCGSRAGWRSAKRPSGDELKTKLELSIARTLNMDPRPKPSPDRIWAACSQGSTPATRTCVATSADISSAALLLPVLPPKLQRACVAVMMKRKGVGGAGVDSGRSTPSFPKRRTDSAHAGGTIPLENRIGEDARRWCPLLGTEMRATHDFGVLNVCARGCHHGSGSGLGSPQQEASSASVRNGTKDANSDKGRFSVGNNKGMVPGLVATHPRERIQRAQIGMVEQDKFMYQYDLLKLGKSHSTLSEPPLGAFLSGKSTAILPAAQEAELELEAVSRSALSSGLLPANASTAATKESTTLRASKKAHGPQYKFWDLGMHPCNTLPPAQQNIAHQNTAPPLTPPPSTQMATARPPPCPSAKCLSCTHPGNAQGVMRHCKVCCHGLATSHCKIHETRPPTPPALTKSSTPVLLKLLPPSQPCSERKLAFCTNKLSMFQNFYTFTFS
ncbi:hypothetical protein DFH08DRAFT_826451 [Mycena albidolilacea]|uniref:Uncharacterized protein n=1 Tax=Mycena albidolilacea TaxID=1033008 RepID=A0AAD7E8D7_9AGAR|nr:hypothetical protein DFH08DRAFT_826451 [Mycena albidolilacea]